MIKAAPTTEGYAQWSNINAFETNRGNLGTKPAANQAKENQKAFDLRENPKAKTNKIRKGEIHCQIKGKFIRL